MIDFEIESCVYGGARIWLYEVSLNKCPGLSGFMNRSSKWGGFDKSESRDGLKRYSWEIPQENIAETVTCLLSGNPGSLIPVSPESEMDSKLGRGMHK